MSDGGKMLRPLRVESTISPTWFETALSAKIGHWI
jgi:hypothetical protein